jgi:hypothetical protein
MLWYAGVHATVQLSCTASVSGTQVFSHWMWHEQGRSALQGDVKADVLEALVNVHEPISVRRIRTDPRRATMGGSEQFG